MPETPPPEFYRFVKAALTIGDQIVRSSELTVTQRQAAGPVFRVRTDEALVKQIETVRGRISHPSPYGLLERPKR